MDKQEILDVMAQKAAEIAKAQAVAVVSSITVDDMAAKTAEIAKAKAAEIVSSITVDELRPLVESQIKLITDPLQAEINSTTSPWVKIRNSVYIKLISSTVDAIISSIQSGLSDINK